MFTPADLEVNNLLVCYLLYNGMANEHSIRFTLNDSTEVSVRKARNNTYDFELLFVNKGRKTFLWSNDFTNSVDRKGNLDKIVAEAIEKFRQITKH